jgi:SAM-dependent methyltransferase
MKRDDPRFTSVNEPFNEGRDAARLIFDFGALLSCFSPAPPNRRTLDFCSGSGWIAEWLNRLGFEVWAIDLSPDCGEVLRLRAALDARLQSDRMAFAAGDAHRLPFEDGFFSHVCSFDSLHHMRDYRQTLAEMARVLAPGGRAVFVEPGSKHSTSPETVAFIKEFKSHDPDWIERDVVLEEIDALGRQAGFSELVLRPLLPAGQREYPLTAWQHFRRGDSHLAADYLDTLKAVNYEAHLVFYLQKPS